MDIRRFSHQHPLALSTAEKIEDSSCSACGQPLAGEPSYGCSTCKFYLHKSCAELPPEIQHPFHPLHPLSLLTEVPPGGFTCDACGNNYFSFSFHCNKCNFDIDAGCASITHTIKYEGHEHLVYLFEKNMTFDRWCNACNTKCYAPFWRCVDCEFNIHVKCGPLPDYATHKYHVHPLKMVGIFVEDDSDQYYCDACETERDPKDCIYYCAECNYVCHVDCLLSEVLPSLKAEQQGDGGNKRLTGGDSTGTSTTEAVS